MSSPIPSIVNVSERAPKREFDRADYIRRSRPLCQMLPSDPLEVPVPTEAPLEAPESTPEVPPATVLNTVAMDMVDMDKPRIQLPANYISVRVTTDNRCVCFDVFKGMCCVIAQETSKSGVLHFHVVVVGHDSWELIGKRLTRLKLGRAMFWRKRNHMEDFLKAVSYTVKCGDYYTRRGFHQYVDIAPDWLSKEEYVATLPEAPAQDKSRMWQFTFANLLPVCFNYRTQAQLKTDKLSAVLEHMMRNTNWVPTPQMVKNGLDPWWHKQFAWMCGPRMESPPQWWESHVDTFKSSFD